MLGRHEFENTTKVAHYFVGQSMLAVKWTYQYLPNE